MNNSIKQIEQAANEVHVGYENDQIILRQSLDSDIPDQINIHYPGVYSFIENLLSVLPKKETNNLTIKIIARDHAFNELSGLPSIETDEYAIRVDSFIAGATWQQSQSVEQKQQPLEIIKALLSDCFTAGVQRALYKNHPDKETYVKGVVASLPTPDPEMKWVSVKPELDRHCILIAASFYNGWNYSSFQIDQVEGQDYNGHSAWYWGILDLSGSEWGAYDDIEADLYCIVEIPAPPLNPQDK